MKGKSANYTRKSSLADLYDPMCMPQDLRKVHEELATS
ncbi:type IIL restriction-modification enzyme MmeI [Gardnerella vaginalis]